MPTFFDCSAPQPENGGIFFDRVYRLAWESFDEAHWKALDNIYHQLPGWLGYDPTPWWFGKDQATAPHLTASVEPPGLQVTGILPEAEFRKWHDAFIVAIAQLPALATG